MQELLTQLGLHAGDTAVSIILLVFLYRFARWLAPLIEKRISYDSDMLVSARIAMEQIAPLIKETYHVLQKIDQFLEAHAERRATDAKNNEGGRV